MYIYKGNGRTRINCEEAVVHPELQADANDGDEADHRHLRLHH